MDFLFYFNNPLIFEFKSNLLCNKDREHFRNLILLFITTRSDFTRTLKYFNKYDSDYANRIYCKIFQLKITIKCYLDHS